MDALKCVTGRLLVQSRQFLVPIARSMESRKI